MKRTLFALAATACVVSCLSNPGFETDDIGGGDNAYKAPVLGSYEVHDTEVKELSSLCMSKDGTHLWSVSDDKGSEGGVYWVDFNGRSERKLSFLHDLEGITIDPATGNLYLAVEGEQAIYKLDETMPKPVKLGEVENGASDPSGKGLEGLTWYKADTLLAANQYSPTSISFFSIAQGKAVRDIKIKFASYLSDLCYDPVDNLLWISDSKAMKIYICDLDGNQKAQYDISGIVGSGKAEGLTIDRANKCIWIGCDVTDKLYKVDVTWN